MTQRWKLTIEYDGTDFRGWQRQKEDMTVQQAVEDAFFKFCKEKVHVQCSGRTDAGVHSVGQVAHVDIKRPSVVKEIRDAVNFHLSDAGHKVSIVSAEKVSDDFHARYSSKKRQYCYKIIANRRSIPVLDERYVWHINLDLDVDAMHKAAQYLLGSHDMSSFRASECQAESPIKTIDKIEVKEVSNPLVAGKHIEIWVEAKSFLHHQVRNITGTLRDVGVGKIKPEDVKTILEARCRCEAGITAPASGLYFVKVWY